MCILCNKVIINTTTNCDSSTSRSNCRSISDESSIIISCDMTCDRSIVFQRCCIVADKTEIFCTEYSNSTVVVMICSSFVALNIDSEKCFRWIDECKVWNCRSCNPEETSGLVIWNERIWRSTTESDSSSCVVGWFSETKLNSSTRNLEQTKWFVVRPLVNTTEVKRSSAIVSN